MIEALIYARFSKLDQIKGHSIGRQTDNTREVCRQQGWVTSPSRTFVEKGKSAFTGANRAKGSLLNTLESEIAAGVHIGRVLVVEHLDRISRQGWEEVSAFLKTCSTNGVTVATFDGSRVYHAHEKIEIGSIIEIIVKADLAEKESETKSKRVCDSFKNKRAAAVEGTAKNIASRPPSWLSKTPAGCVLIEDRANIVREAYRLASSGWGTPAIATHLNESGIPTWRASSKGWHESYVARMLSNRAAIGEYISAKHDVRIVGYYPPVVEVDLFNRVQAARAQRRIKGAGPRGVAQANLFGGVAICADCGARMYMKPSRRAGRNEKRTSPRTGAKAVHATTVNASYLVCNAARRRLKSPSGNRVCENSRSIRYEVIEPIILDKVLNLALDNDVFNVTEISRTRIDLAETERMIDAKEDEIAKLAENLKAMVSPTLMEILSATEKAVGDAKVQRDALRRALSRESGSAPSAETLARIKSMRAALTSADIVKRREARMLVADALKSIITSIQCDTDATVTVSIAHGLAAFEIDARGKITKQFDGSSDPVYVASLKSRALASNAERVDHIIKRARAAA